MFLWIIEHKHVWRAVVLGLLLLAIIGPWAFDRINVPAQYTCSAPFIRLEGDFCGEPLAGIFIFSWVLLGFIQMVAYLVAGGPFLPERAREMFFSLFPLLLVLPLITTLRIILGETRRRWQVIHIIALALAAGPTLLLVVASFSSLRWELWGIWLYIGVATSALLLEVFTLNRAKPTLI